MTPRLELNFPNPIETRSDLFDREPQLALVQETLRSPSRRPVVIRGERVMGKTSLLNVVVEWALAESRFCVLQLPPVSSREAFMEEILEGMATEVRTSLYRLGLRDERGRFLPSTVIEFARVAGELSSAATGKTFLLCLEELDSMLVNCPDAAAGNQILDFILYVVSKTSLPIKFVFTLTRTSPQIVRSDASQFMSSARITRLLPWTSEEVRGFVDWLLHGERVFDEDAHELLYAAGGGHPYLTKAVLQTLQELGRPAPGARVAIADVREAIEATVTSPEVDFTLDNIVKVHLSDPELHVLRQVAAGPEPTEPVVVDAPAEVIEGLRERGYLRAHGGNRYTQAFGLLGEWLSRKPGSDGRRTFGIPPEPSAEPADAPEDLPLLRVDDIRKRVFLGDDEVALTAQEYRFLNCLITHAGSVVDRYTVATEVWPEEVLVEGVREGRLDALVHRLREELGGEASRYIETRRGRGYYANPALVRRVPRAVT